MDEALKDSVQQAREKIKEIYDQGFTEINSRKYVFTQMTHEQRRRVFAYYTSIREFAQKQNYFFLDTPEYKKIELVMFERITIDDLQVSKADNHFEKHPGDYLLLVLTALAVISYPFFPGNLTS